MKKSLLLFVYISALALNVPRATAQDTLTMGTDRYYVRNAELVFYIEDFGLDASNEHVLYNKFYTSTPVTIYGIGLDFSFKHYEPSQEFFDSIVPMVFDIQDLNMSDGQDSDLVVYASAHRMSKINYFTYEFLYRFHRDFDSAYLERLDTPIVRTRPIYEYYFDSAITVHDSVLIGFVNHYYRHAVLFNPYYVCHECDVLYYNFWINNYGIRGYHAVMFSGLEWWGGIFPILQPPDTADTTGTNGIALPEADKVELWPNPSTGRVTVMTEGALRSVAICNMQGHTVLQRTATGRKAELDASALPKGCYLLTAVTTAGVTRKKLVLQ